jgi:SRSO17 transposase
VTTGPARKLLRRLGQFLDGFSACFSRQPQREAASQYLDGLLNDSERKSMQAMHGRLSDPGQYQALQHFITHSPWDAQRVWTQLRTVVPIRTGILAIDDTGFPKQGTQSVGVQRQYCGALGKIGNCQVAVSSALIADGRTWPLAYEPVSPGRVD